MTDALRVVVSGATGRMGRELVRLISEDSAMELAGGLDREGRAGGEAGGGLSEIRRLEEAADLLAGADVVVDFSAPQFLRRLLTEQRDAVEGRALVVGTTGLEAEDQRLLDELSTVSPVLSAANFSIGVNVLFSLVEQAARALGPDYDIEIVEAHHRRKEDAPSGTALALGEAAARGRQVELADVRRDGRSGRPGARPDGEIGFHAVRGGDVVGDHQVLFLGGLDRIELSHRAADRGLFAAGALHAARWLVHQPAGRYSLRDALGLA